MPLPLSAGFSSPGTTNAVRNNHITDVIRYARSFFTIPVALALDENIPRGFGGETPAAKGLLGGDSSYLQATGDPSTRRYDSASIVEHEVSRLREVAALSVLRSP